MSQALAFAVLAGIVSGGLALAPLSGSISLVLLAYFVQLPLMLAGLTMGLAAAMVATLSAAVINGLVAGVLPALIFLVILGLPALVVVRQALLSRQQAADLIWYPPGLILAQLTAMAAAGIVLAFVAFLGQPGGLLGAIETFLTDAIAELSNAAGRPMPDLTPLRDRVSTLPALVAISWLVMVILNGVLAQVIAVRVGWNRRPTPEFSVLELPFWLWPLMGLAAFFALVGGGDLNALGRSVLMLLAVPFAFQGLAVIHKFANRWSHRQLGLAAVYAGIVVFNWPILAVVALGLVEDWVHLRRHM